MMTRWYLLFARLLPPLPSPPPVPSSPPLFSVSPSSPFSSRPFSSLLRIHIEAAIKCPHLHCFPLIYEHLLLRSCQPPLCFSSIHPSNYFLRNNFILLLKAKVVSSAETVCVLDHINLTAAKEWMVSHCTLYHSILSCYCMSSWYLTYLPSPSTKNTAVFDTLIYWHIYVLAVSSILLSLTVTLHTDRTGIPRLIQQPWGGAQEKAHLEEHRAAVPCTWGAEGRSWHRRSSRCVAVQYSSVPCSAVWYSAVWYNAAR